MSRLVHRAFRPGDEEAILDLHARAYGPGRTRAHWDWRFKHNPAGRTELRGAFDQDGRCMAVFAGVSQRFVVDGRDEHFAQNWGDIAVDPELRGGIGGSGTAVRVGCEFVESHSHSSKLMYGWPEPGLRRIIVRFMRAEALTDVVFLVHELRAQIEPAPSLEVRPVPSLGADAQALWEAFRASVRATIVRDVEYLHWRYRDHPSIDYVLVEARERSSGALRGVAAFREGGWDASLLTLSELLVPQGDAEAERALVAHAAHEARARGRDWLVAWLPSESEPFRRFQCDYGFFARGTPYQEVFRSWIPSADRNWLHAHWYQSMGDIDFF